MLSLLLLIPLIQLVTLGSAQGITCNVTSPCPTSAPCCSEYGYCGTGEFCLGGCNPIHSHSLNSCMPNPVCESAQYVFTDNSRILSNVTHFDGNATEWDWTLDKGNMLNTNTSGGELALLLTQTNGGSRISSTRYLHYGTVTARIKTGRWGGVVTAFITMSSIKDEIDWEWPGANTTQAQTNYFWQGFIPAQTNGLTTGGLTDTFSNYHDYTIDWQSDTLTWLIDGNIVRTLKKSDTINSNGVALYPTTPARIQISIWPAGIQGSPAGTVQWAGGMINWNDPDYASAGHFYTLISSVNVTCNDPVKPTDNVTSYVYTPNVTAFTPGIEFSNQTTINSASTGYIVNPLFMLAATAASLFLTLSF
ncbi:glycoside hydrolase family 16 protein [Thelephora terrestris]|uniref:Glycoside hydrolase family 16 protein n=1 Tax=Thelephora terrestris TaxID=56493 RepID=A0A9P6HIW1_9AGAM|nr:glycoside hydrolase family 16 protein [Thelephora terrestris]